MSTNFTHRSGLKIPSMTWMPTWQHFWRRDLGLVFNNLLRLRKKPNPTLNTSPENIFAQTNQDMSLIYITHILMVPGGSNVKILPLRYRHL